MTALINAWTYGIDHLDEFIQALLDHISILGISLGAAILICIPLGILAARSVRLTENLMNIIAGLRVIPSLAILFLVVPYLGLNNTSAIFALTLLAMPPIFINTTVAFQTLDAATLEAAEGLGMNSRQVFWKIKVPLVLPIVLTGIRTAAVEVTASATLAAFVGSGGLGIYITRGFAQYDIAILMVGAIPVALLTLLIENLLVLAQKLVATPVH